MDFGRLAPIFLVCGKTGSGKTTIFDALTYALYGQAPGSRAGLERQLCSQYARPGERPLVEFEFALGGESLRATRSPPYRRLNRKGEEAEVPAAARLERREGQSWILLGEKIGEVDEAVRSRLGLSAQEFSKIILLPQGEFQRFLEMDSSERVSILEKLFPVELHEAVTLLARERAKAALEEARRIDAELARLAAEGLTEGAPALREALAAEAAGLEGSRSAALAALREADAALTRGREAAARRANLERAEAALAALEAGAEAAAAQRARAEAGRRAAPLLPLLEAQERASAALLQGKAEAVARQAALAEAESRREAAEASRAEAERAGSELAGMDREIGELEKAAEAWKGASLAAAALEAARVKARESERARAEAEDRERRSRERLAALSLGAEEEALVRADFERARGGLEKAKELEGLAAAQEAAAQRSAASAEEARRSAEAAAPLAEGLARLERARELGLAATLASGLEEGLPCPVCGALHHPNPAPPPREEEIPQPGELEALRAKRDDLLSSSAAARAWAEQDAAALGEARARLREALVEASGSELAAAGSELAAAGTAASSGALPGREEARQWRLAAEARAGKAAATLRELESRRRAAELARAELEAFREALRRAEMGAKDASVELARGEEALAQARKHSGGEDPAPRLQYLRAARLAREESRHVAAESAEAWEREWGRASALAAESAARMPALEAEARRSAEAAAAALAAADFPTALIARQAALPARELGQLEARAAAYDRELAAARAAAVEARRAIGQPLGTELEPEIALAELESAAARARAALDEAQGRLEKAREALSRLDRLSAERERLLSERRALDERSGRLAALAALLAGEISGRRLPFKNFVLGAYFRRVVELASARLAEMSDGRYGLLADEGGGRGRLGLELLVRDAYTGRTRPAGTLSGGERFLSSLALALGLADAIRSRSGGVELDAVFIDEGFGSLDEEALDRAVAALDRARGARTIGIVSHVAELRSRIASRIEVRKGRSGSSLEIVG